MQQSFKTVNRVVRLVTVGNRIGVKRVGWYVLVGLYPLERFFQLFDTASFLEALLFTYLFTPQARRSNDCCMGNPYFSGCMMVVPFVWLRS